MKILIFLLLIFIDIVCVQELPPKYRLQHNALPKSYNIKLTPSIENTTFTGEVTIFVQVKHSIKNITVNSKNLEILDLVLDSSMESARYELITQYEILNIFHADGGYIEPGEHMIHIKFKGQQTNDSTGIFRSNFQSDGLVLSIGTMFSASYARMAFPCFDDPAYKSEFSVRIVKQKPEYRVLSNTEEIGSFETEDGLAVDFRTTPPISPYLLCFVLTRCNYSTVSFESKDGRIIPIRFFLMDEYLDQTPFLLQVAKNALQYFEEFTNMTYPVSKLDLIEVESFIFEGMENIGLIILTHNSVSFNGSTEMSKVSHQRNAAALIVHEIAHMWFGDIVTEMWYNDLWLTEGVTEYMEIHGLANQFPNWQLLEEEAALGHKYVYYKDVTSNSSIPLIFFPNTDDQIEQLFDDLTYSKGDAVVTMVRNVMGPSKFQEGMRYYLEKFQYAVTSTADFINAMQKVVPDLNLWGFLETWLFQNRYPLVTISSDEFSKAYTLRQSNFYVAAGDSSKLRQTWTIPIFYRRNCDEKANLVWFDKDSDEVNLDKCEDEKWIKLNYGSEGCFRVLYTSKQYKNLLKYFHELPEVDQANLIEETFHLTKINQLSCEIPISFIRKLKGSKALLPVLAATQVLQQSLTDSHENFRLKEKLTKFSIDIFEKLYLELSWQVSDGEDHTKRMLRSAIFEFICDNALKFKKCYDDAEELKLKGAKIHPDINFIFRKIKKVEQENRPKINIWEYIFQGNSKKSISPAQVENSKLYPDSCSAWMV